MKWTVVLGVLMSVGGAVADSPDIASQGAANLPDSSNYSSKVDPNQKPVATAGVAHADAPPDNAAAKQSTITIALPQSPAPASSYNTADVVSVGAVASNVIPPGAPAPVATHATGEALPAGNTDTLPLSTVGVTTAALPVVTTPTAALKPTAVVAISAATSSKAGAIITLGDSLYTAGPSGLAIGPTTLEPGGAVGNVGGQIVSVGLDFVIVDGSVIPYTSIIPPPKAATFSLQGQIYTAAPTGFSIDSVTLRPGDDGKTVGGQYLSVASNAVVVGKNTLTFTYLPPMTTMVGGVYTLGATPYTYISGSGLVVQGVTLKPGGPEAVIGGTTVSVASSGVVIGTDLFVASTMTRTLNGLVATTGAGSSLILETGSPTHARAASLATSVGSQTMGGELPWLLCSVVASVIISFVCL